MPPIRASGAGRPPSPALPAGSAVLEVRDRRQETSPAGSLPARSRQLRSRLGRARDPHRSVPPALPARPGAGFRCAGAQPTPWGQPPAPILRPSCFQAPSLRFPVKSPPGAVFPARGWVLLSHTGMRSGSSPLSASWSPSRRREAFLGDYRPGLAHLLPPGSPNARLVLPEPPKPGAKPCISCQCSLGKSKSSSPRSGPVPAGFEPSDVPNHIRPPRLSATWLPLVPGRGRAVGQSRVLCRRWWCWHRRRFAWRAPAPLAVPREDAVPPLATHPKVFPRRVLHPGLTVPTPVAAGAEPSPHPGSASSPAALWTLAAGENSEVCCRSWFPLLGSHPAPPSPRPRSLEGLLRRRRDGTDGICFGSSRWAQGVFIEAGVCC